MDHERSEEPAVPVGLEQVLLLAGMEPRLGEALAQSPEAVLAASGVELTNTERAILGTVDEARLGQMAARLVAVAPEPTRRAFLGQASVVLVALGATAGLSVGCEDKQSKTGSSGGVSGSAGGEGTMAAMARKRQGELKRRHRVAAPTGVRPRFPQMTAGKPVIKGPLDTDGVRRRLKGYGGAVKKCWLTRNRHHPPLGMLRLDLTVNRKGKVSKAAFGAGTLKNGDIEGCILTEARGWSFPPSTPQPTTIKITYRFEMD